MNQTNIYTAKDLETPLCLSYEQCLEALQHGIIEEEVGMMRWGSNYTFLVDVLYQDLKFMAIYKPRSGERPLWDFPDGTLCQRETAAYVLSEMLTWQVVPPTILRDGSRGMGSVQVFIQHEPERHYFTFDERHTEQVKKLALFDALANNADRKGGHCLLDETERVWGIDHGLTFNAMPKLRTVIWDYAGQPIDAANLAQLKHLCLILEDSSNPLTQELCNLIAAYEFNALMGRLNKLIQSKIYPMPGAGPNRPWPAI